MYLLPRKAGRALNTSQPGRTMAKQKYTQAEIERVLGLLHTIGYNMLTEPDQKIADWFDE